MKFYEGRAAFILPIITATLSFFSSAFILWIIWKSKRNTSYHRIMAVMSIWEMVRTLCIALSTLPMPKDVIYNYYGKSYGNVQTCEAQAFVLLVGAGMTLFSNVFLNLYYLLAIRFNVSENILKKCLEPIFWVISTALSFTLPIVYLRIEYLNPTPYETFCNVGTYPKYCGRTGKSCIRGEALSVDMFKFFRNFVFSMISLELIFLIVSMALIVMTFYKNDIELARRRKDLKNGKASDLIPLRSRRFTSKIIAQQALMYFTALVLSWSFFVISFYEETLIISILKQIFFPLRGMLNMLIFVYHKLYALKRSHSGMSYFDALKFLIGNTKDIPEDVVSNLEIVLESTGGAIPSPENFEQLRHFNIVGSPSESEHSFPPLRIQRHGMDIAEHCERSLCNHDSNHVVPEQCTAQDFNSVSMFSGNRSALSSYMLDDIQCSEVDTEDIQCSEADVEDIQRSMVDEEDILHATETQSK